jgi:protein gp37
MSDLFHENVTDEMRDQIFAVMALCPQHVFQVLTKRPERMLSYLGASSILRTDRIVKMVGLRFPIGTEAKLQPICWPLPNVWLGVSVENRAAANERIPLLLQTPAAKRFVSCEPLLSKLTFRWARWDDHAPNLRRVKQLPPVERGGKILAGCVDHLDGLRMLDWVICGGESGPHARPMHPNWARSLRDQCAAAQVPFFLKQWGEWAPTDFSVANGGHVSGDGAMARVGKKSAGALLDGQEYKSFPVSER